MVKVSVIIPVYNAQEYLRECLDSVLGQPLRDIEVLCVDDGSTDSSPAILSDYAARDGRVRVIKGAHRGAYKARETAFAEVIGEFVYFMDADDVLVDGALSECYDLAVRERLDHLVFSAENFVTGDGDTRLDELKAVYDRYYRLDDAVCGKVMPGRELMSELIGHDCFFESPPLRLIRTMPLKSADVPVPDALFHGDSYWTPVSLYFSSRAMAINRRLYRRRLRGGSITTSQGVERIHFASTLDVLFCLCRVAPFAKDAVVTGSAAWKYLRHHTEMLALKGGATDEETMFVEFDKLAPTIPEPMRLFVSACFLPVFRDCIEAKKLSSVPVFIPTIRSCALYIAKRLCFRIKKLFSPQGACV